MTLKKAAEKLGMETFPEAFFEIEGRLEEYRDRLCSLELIERLEKKFNLFADHFEAAKEAWADIETKPEMKLWMNIASVYALENELSLARKTPFPASDKTPAGNMLPVFILLPSVEGCYENYQKRGFSREDAARFLDAIKINMTINKNGSLGASGLTKGYFDWVMIYIKTQIFDFGGLNFEVKKANGLSLILKNKKSGEVAPLLVNRQIHKSGRVLGSGGAEDEEGSWTATFEETADAFIGYPVEDYLVSPEKKTFPKSEWEVALGLRDDVVGIHIPRKTDFSPEAVSAALEGAKEILDRCYPDFCPKAYNCTSWLLDPNLKSMMGEKSKITAFAERFVRYPTKSTGREVFSFVFNRKFGDFESLPENTSLERGLKAKYLAGEYIHGHTGVILLD